MHQELEFNRPLYYPIKNQQYARTGHRIISFQGQILIFGGLSPYGEYNPILMKLNCETMTLDIIHTVNYFRLQGFSLFVYNGRIFVWGGSGPTPDNVRTAVCRNKLLQFKGNDFQEVQQHGKVPAARQTHASCIVSNKYLMIMGGNNGHTFFNDWHLLDLTSMTWSQLSLSSKIPTFLDTTMIWFGGRGFLVTGQSYEKSTETITMTENKMYEFRFSNFKQRKLDITPINVTQNAMQQFPRGAPTTILVNLSNPYIILLGGTKQTSSDPLAFCTTVECFNIQTLEWFTIDCAMKAGFGFQAVFSGQKIYLVGGLTKSKEVIHFVQYIEFHVNFIETKVCKVCREVYGFKHIMPSQQQITIKYQTETTSKTFFSSDLIGRFSSYIAFPFSALGLLIDNSLNLSGTDIDISFVLAGETEEERQYKRQRGLEELTYDYIEIIDNSVGFTQHQILETLCSFTLKTEKFTGDKRYEQEIEIKRQYGLNLHLGALRLGKSCLYMTRTEDRSRLIAFFSATVQYQRSPYTVYSYILNSQGHCTSALNRDIIKQNVKGKVPANYQTISGSTIIYIFDLPRKELVLKKQKNLDLSVNYLHAPFKVFRCLFNYVESLYLRPKIGRKIAVNKKEIKYISYLEILKENAEEGKIIEVGPSEVSNQVFKHCKIYKLVTKNYFLQNILCYQNNRLICAFQGNSQFCGIIQLTERVQVDLCKTKIENKTDQLTILRFIQSVFHSYAEKRFPEQTTPKIGGNEPLKMKKERL